MTWPQLAPLCKCALESDPSAIVLLFGSRGRGDHEPWSDYDVYVLADRELSRDELYQSVRDLRLDLHLATVSEYEARLRRWARAQGNTASKLKKLRMELSLSLQALNGVCLAGEQSFRRFRDLRDEWVADGIMPDPSLSRFVSIEDGLTDAQRSLVAATKSHEHQQGKQRYVKSSRIVGNASEEGLAGVSFLYRSLVKMLQPWVTRYPLFDGQGNFGSRGGSPAAAMRYTEFKASKFAWFGCEKAGCVTPDKLLAAAEAFRELAEQAEVTSQQVKSTMKNILSEKYEYDPLRFPNLLANGTYGIPGIESAVPSFALNGVVDALRMVIERPKVADEDLLDAIGLPDLASGGVFCDSDEIREALASGEGNVRLVAHYETTKATHSDDTSIAIVTLPPGVFGWDLQEDISKSIENGELPGAKTAKDESCLERGFRFEIPIETSADADALIKRIVELPSMRAELPVDLTVLRDGSPVQMSLPDLIRHDAERRMERIGSKDEVLAELNELRELDTNPPRMQLRKSKN